MTTPLTAAGDLRVEPVQTAVCAATSDPFERRLARAFDSAVLTPAWTLRLTIAAEGESSGEAPPPRALAKVWGYDETFATPLDPAARGFQTVTLALPGPPIDGGQADTMVAFVGVDPPAPYVVRSVALEAHRSAATDGQKNAH